MYCEFHLCLQINKKFKPLLGRTQLQTSAVIVHRIPGKSENDFIVVLTACIIKGTFFQKTCQIFVLVFVRLNLGIRMVNLIPLMIKLRIIFWDNIRLAHSSNQRALSRLHLLRGLHLHHKMLFTKRPPLLRQVITRQIFLKIKLCQSQTCFLR